MDINDPTEPQAPQSASVGLTARGRVWIGLCLVLVLVVGAGLRLTFLIGPAGSDDMRYMRAAELIADGETTDRLDHAWVRAAFVLWLALWVKLGAGTLALALSEVVLSLATMLTLFWLATRWASAAVGVLAVLWLAFMPLDLLTSGLVAPDRFALLLGLLAVGCADGALRAAAGKGRLQLVLASVFTGLAVSAKEPSVILPIIFIVYAVWRVRPVGPALARAVLMGALSVGVFALEHLFFHVWTGDWAYRYHAINAIYSDPALVRAIDFKELVFYLAHLLANPAVMGLFGWLMLIALLRTFGKLREPGLIVIWSICYFLFLQYGSTSLQEYHPMPKQWRYMLPIVILLTIPLGCWTIELFRSATLGKIGTLLLVCGVFVSGLLGANERAAERFYSEDSIRCLAIARRHADDGHSIAVPKWVVDGTALEFRAMVRDWETVDLSDGLQREEAKRIAARDALLLVPNVMWHHKRDEPSYMKLRDELTRHANVEPILDWRSPLDRLISHIAVLKPLAKRIVIGRYYRIDASTLEVWDSTEEPPSARSTSAESSSTLSRQVSVRTAAWRSS